MAINPINYAMIQRVNDVGNIKHSEDNRPMVNQQNIQVQVDKREDVLRHQVINKADSERAKNDADAREEGKNKYRKRSQQKKDKDKASAGEAKVVRKQGGGGFDISV